MTRRCVKCFGRRPVACAPQASVRQIPPRPAAVLGARALWVAGIGAVGEAGGIECEPLAMVAATPVYTVRQPALATGKGTIRLRPEDAAGIPDDELGDLQRRTQGPDCLRAHAGGRPARTVVSRSGRACVGGSAVSQDLPGAQIIQFGLDGCGPPRRGHGTDAGDGGTRRLRVPARASARAGGRDPVLACRSSSARATTATPSSPPRSWRPSEASSAKARRRPDPHALRRGLGREPRGQSQRPRGDAAASYGPRCRRPVRL